MALRGGLRTLTGLALSALLLAPAGCGGSNDGPTSLIQPPSAPPAAPKAGPVGSQVMARSGGTVEGSATFTPNLPLTGYNGVGFQHLTIDAISGGGQVLGLAYWTGTNYQFGNLTVPEINALGTTRGYWLFTNGPTSFTYSGNDSSGNRNVPLGFGWNMVAFPAQQDVQASTLQTFRAGAPVNMTSVIATDFFEVNTNNQNVPVNVLAPGATLRAGRPYWVYAAESVTLTYSVPVPSPSPSVSASVSPTPVPSVSPVAPTAGSLVFEDRVTLTQGDTINFPAITPNGRFIYLPMLANNFVTFLSVDANGRANFAGETTVGSQPGAAIVSADSSRVYIVNTGSDTISAFSINATTGAMGPLGTPVPTGRNPLRGAIHPTAPFLYVPNFQAATISRYHIQADGSLTPQGTTPIPGVGPDNVNITPDGRFLYASNGHAFSINTVDGSLTPLTGSPFASLFAPSGGTSSQVISPNGNFIYVSDAPTGNLSVLGLNTAGNPSLLIPGTNVAPTPNVTTMAIDTAGRNLYMCQSTGNRVLGFALNPTSGAFTPVAGSPYDTGGVGVQPRFPMLGNGRVYVGILSKSLTTYRILP